MTHEADIERIRNDYYTTNARLESALIVVGCLLVGGGLVLVALAFQVWGG